MSRYNFLVTHLVNNSLGLLLPDQFVSDFCIKNVNNNQSSDGQNMFRLLKMRIFLSGGNWNEPSKKLPNDI